jgi:hypothetical protein
VQLLFEVEGRPPRKYASESGWGKNEAKYILKLRERALEARKKAGMDDCFRGPIKLELVVYAPNITNKIAPDHIGDLDALAGGVCEALQPAHPNAPNSLIFAGKHEVNPSIPLIIEDDSLVVHIVARKETSSKTYYTVKVELVG